MTDVALVLEKLADLMSGEIVPKLDGSYAAGQVSMSAALISMVSEAFDVAADRLVTEIRSTRALLAAGGVDAATVPEAGSFRVSELTKERDALARLLIDLQAGLETRSDDASRALNAQIWDLHVATVLARMPSPPDLSRG